MKRIINVWELWEKEFYNAKAFFDSKGDMKTKSRLKDKWYKSFEKSLKSVLFGDE